MKSKEDAEKALTFMEILLKLIYEMPGRAENNP